jgi:hypothetical protein
MDRKTGERSTPQLVLAASEAKSLKYLWVREEMHMNQLCVFYLHLSFWAVRILQGGLEETGPRAEALRLTAGCQPWLWE